MGHRARNTAEARRVRTRRHIVAIAVYAFCFIFAFALENTTEILDILPGLSKDAWYRKAMEAGFWYQWLADVGPRAPRVHRVSLVTLTKGSEPDPVLLNVCSMRAFMAKLIDRIAGVSPDAIVIDRAYAKSACTDIHGDDAATIGLRVSVRAASQKTPIIIGLATDSREDLENDNRPANGVTDRDLLLQEHLDFEATHGEAVSFGLLRFNYDTRKLPFGWYVFESKTDISSGKRTRLPTLAVAAVNKVDPSTLDTKVYRTVDGSGKHPFVQLLGENKFRSYPAINLICGEGQSNWQDCTGGPEQAQRLMQLSHRVVLIAERDPKGDFHETVLGRVPGHLLHANYIEALLDDRYLRPVPGWIQFAMSVVWFLVVETILMHWASRPERGLLLAIIATVFLAFLFYYVAVLLLGFYLVLWIPTAAAILTRYIILRHEVTHKQEEHGHAA